MQTMLKTQTTGYIMTETEATFRPYYQQQHQLPNDINKNNHPNGFSTAIIEKGKNKQKATLKPFLSNRMSGAKYKTFVEEVKTSLSLMCHYQSVRLSFCVCTDLYLLMSVYDNVITDVKTVLNKASFVERLCFV